MKKGAVFICLLLLIIMVETIALLWHIKNPAAGKYQLATEEYVLSKTDVSVIKPFLFEENFAEEINKSLDEVSEILNVEKTDTIEVIPAQIMERNARELPAEIDEESEPTAEEKNALTKPAAEGKKEALIAVVIDDVGLSVTFTNQIAKIKQPITVAFLPYGASNKQQVDKLKNAGFEVMLHTPMMPEVPADLAPITLSPKMSKEEIQEKFSKMLNRFAKTGMVGANNHMGSLFTQDKPAMRAVIEILRDNNMFFLDSKTTSKSVSSEICKEYRVPYIARDVFLDNKKDYDAIMQQFLAAERIAKKRGYAVAIGHPYAQTLQVLKDWEKKTKKHGVKIVPLSYLVSKTN